VALDAAVERIQGRLNDHIKKSDLDLGSILQEQGRLNTKIDTVQTQVLEKRGSFDVSSSSSGGKDGRRCRSTSSVFPV
jgi:hypothetical protein